MSFGRLTHSKCFLHFPHWKPVGVPFFFLPQLPPWARQVLASIQHQWHTNSLSCASTTAGARQNFAQQLLSNVQLPALAKGSQCCFMRLVCTGNDGIQTLDLSWLHDGTKTTPQLGLCTFTVPSGQKTELCQIQQAQMKPCWLLGNAIICTMRCGTAWPQLRARKNKLKILSSDLSSLLQPWHSQCLGNDVTDQSLTTASASRNSQY